MATITMALDKPKGFDGFNKDENPKTSSILKPIKYAIIGMTVVGGVYGAKELIKNFNNPNPNNKNNITNVVKTDSTAKTNIDPDTVADYSEYVNNQNLDNKNKNLDGDPELTAQLQSIVDKYKNSTNQDIKQSIQRFEEMISDGSLTLKILKDNMEITIQDMFAKGHNTTTQDLDFIDFCDDMNQNITGLNIDTQRDKVISDILQKKANATPLKYLKQNPTFAANWQDACNLINKRNELTAKGDLTDDDKILLAMDEYSRFKEYNSTANIKTIRTFLIFYYSDISYDDPKQKSDSEVVTKYIEVMQGYEKKMQNTPNLSPSYRNIQEVDVADL